MCENNSIYLIGAGFSKAINDQIPLNKNLAEELVKYGCKSVKKYVDKYKSDDIEEILTYFDLDDGEKIDKKKEREAITEEISSYFKNFRFKETDTVPSWLKMFALEVLKQNDSIICLNYDCTLEGVLDYLGVWSPNGGYARIENPLSNNILKNQKNIQFFKIHGSENFVESEVKNEFEQTGISLIIDSSIYPKSGANCNYGGGANAKPYIVAPSFVKVPHVDITAMMLDLLDIAKEANNMVIIGCSLRPEDFYLRLLLTCFLNRDLKNKPSLVVIDPYAEQIINKIHNYWVGHISKYVNVQFISGNIEKNVRELIEIANN